MNISYEKMLFYNDLNEYQVSIEGKKVASAFKNNDISNLEVLLNEYYVARNSTGLHYDNENELKVAIENDKYIANLYKELN